MFDCCPCTCNPCSCDASLCEVEEPEDPEPVDPTVFDVYDCHDNDYCLQNKPGFGSTYNCFDSAEDYCEGDYANVMAECCPVSCYYCKPDHELTFAWVGCYRDDANRNLGLGPKDYGYDPESCAEACQAFDYFGLQHGGWCNCGNSYGDPASEYPRLTPGECELNGGSKYLGAGWSNSVFIIFHEDVVVDVLPEPEP